MELMPILTERSIPSHDDKGRNNWKLHSEKKEYQNGAPGELLLQMVPFLQRGTLFSLIIMFMGHQNSTPKGAILRTVK